MKHAASSGGAGCGAELGVCFILEKDREDFIRVAYTKIQVNPPLY
jgi:hypothetical protein